MGSLPRNASGKIRHRSLAETLQESFLGLRRHTTEIRALATASGAPMLHRFMRPFREFGWFAGLIYFADRVLQRLSPRAASTSTI
jgi:hypothetical protein